MEKYWGEAENGVVFSGMPIDSYERERLEMLYYEGIVEAINDDYFLSYDNMVVLSDVDAELFSLPEKNPYQLSMMADGTVGFDDLHYKVQILQPNGQAFINPTICGCIMHIDEERVYRLNESQYKMICLMNESNNNVPNMDRRELTSYSLVNLARIQRHAKKTDARLDPVLSSENQEIHISEKIDVEFVDDGKGNMQVNPVIIEEETGKELEKDYELDFQKQFARAGEKTVYNTVKGDKKVKIVCPTEVKAGLAKVKRVNRKKISIEDGKRYIEQPRELFDDDIFQFRNKAHDYKQNEIFDGEDINNEQFDEGNVWEAMPEEGEFSSSEYLYSDRIKGVAKIVRSVYNGSGYKTDWLGQEGTAFPETADDKNEELQDSQSEINDEKKSINTTLKHDEIDEKKINIDGYGKADLEKDEMSEDEGTSIEKNAPVALDIKPNFEEADYARNLKERVGHLDDGALKDGIKLYDYQEEAVGWMFKAWLQGWTGVLLADDMGLGKTLQTLAFIAKLKKGLGEDGNKPVLIVGPTALLRNWENEYEKFVEKGIFSGIVSLHGSSIRSYQTGEETPNGKKKLELKIPKDCIALTTYETLRDYQFSFAEVTWGIIVVDEAQKIKNPSTGVTIAIKAMNYDYTVCLSGTPVENSWSDLWSIMDFVHPQKLGTLKEFRNTYVSRLKDLEGDVKGIEALGMKLKSELNPLFMRRMKNDKLPGLPKKTLHICRQDMPDYQKMRYMAVIDAANNEDVHPLMTIARLRDVSLHPDIGIKMPAAFYEMEPEEVIGQSARLIQTFKILKDIQGKDEKALIFVVSKKMQLILRYLIKVVFSIQVSQPINGEMNGASRQRLIDQFNMTNGFSVLILSPEAAGVGFTITSANHVIHLSRTWNPAKEDQATDRVYRIGQKRDVHVYLPLACLGTTGNSFDDKLNELLEYKRSLSDNVLFPTGDDAKDGQKIFNDCINNGRRGNDTRVANLTIEDVDTYIGIVFEQIVADIYGRKDGVKVRKTKDTNDNGADIVVIYEHDRSGLLIQCKHKDDPYTGSLGKRGIQEVCAAVNYYKNLDEYRGIEFKTAVVTNAKEFSAGARELAASNSVQLIARNELKHMLDDVQLPNVY